MLVKSMHIMDVSLCGYLLITKTVHIKFFWCPGVHYAIGTIKSCDSHVTSFTRHSSISYLFSPK